MKKHTKPIFVAALLFSISMLCTLFTIVGREAQSDEQIATKLTASFYPVYVTALNVTDGAEGVSVVNLTESLTGCPHEYQLTPENMRTLSNSDILLKNGAGMEEFLDNTISNYPDLKVADLSELAGVEVSEEECHDHEGGEHHHHVNGHIWMNPDMYMRQVDAMANFLAVNDSKNGQTYLTNASSYKERISAAAQGLPKDMEGKKVIVFHDSLEYLCEYMGLEIVMTVEMETDIPLSASTVAQAVQMAKTSGVAMILCEKQFSDSAAASVAKEAGIPLVILDSGVSGEAEKDGYINMLRFNAERFGAVGK